MSYGLPCIVSNIPENMEVIKGAGLSFALDSAADLKKVLESALENLEDLISMGVKAKEIVLAEHDWKKRQLSIPEKSFAVVGEMNDF